MPNPVFEPGRPSAIDTATFQEHDRDAFKSPNDSGPEILALLPPFEPSISRLLDPIDVTQKTGSQGQLTPESVSP
jgi:hypothetical protein